MKKIEHIIENMIPDPSQYIIGYADMGNLLHPFHQFRYAISLAKKLHDDIIDDIENGPNHAYFDLYHSTNTELNTVVKNISSKLDELGMRNTPIYATVLERELDENYRQALTYHTSHKMVATRAGIGWIGKTDLLVSYKFGPRIRLASLLIDYTFDQFGIPVEQSQCETCNVCVRTCPAHAANGTHWTVHIERNEFYDPFKCRDTCRELSKQNMQKDISLCGICIAVCPKGKQ